MDSVPTNSGNQLQDDVLKTLLYYDIWGHPLSSQELFAFLPTNSMTLGQFRTALESLDEKCAIRSWNDYYYLNVKNKQVVQRRGQKERHARRLWLMARCATHVIKRFPFVRAVFVSGELSKNATSGKSDIDYFIITEPERLWIARTLLILFKKVFLFNQKKFFCLNYFVSSDNLRLDEQNIFVATEIAHLKPLYNSALFHEYMKQNRWIRNYFPNFDLAYVSFPRANDSGSRFQRIVEVLLSVLPCDTIDQYLQAKMESIWEERYPEFDETVRKKIFRCTRKESRAYVGNFEEKILAIYAQKLRMHGLAQ